MSTNGIILIGLGENFGFRLETPEDLAAFVILTRARW